MPQPRILWVDVTTRGPSTALLESLRQLTPVRELGQIPLAAEALDFDDVDVIFFDYDYPDIASLKLLQNTREEYPRLPIVMLTEQHSEALAVWAFRSGVWDYLVKPLSRLELEQLVSSLTSAEGVRCRSCQSGSRAFMVPIPDEVKFRGLSLDEQSIQPAISFVASHYKQKIVEKNMAKLCHMGTFRFSRTFRKVMEVTFQEFLVRYRLKESCRMLLNPSSTVADVAFSVGFNDASYFTRVFKKYMSLSPSEYRQGLERAEIRHARQMAAMVKLQAGTLEDMSGEVRRGEDNKAETRAVKSAPQ